MGRAPCKYSLFSTNHLPEAEYMVWYIGRRVVGVLMDPSFSYKRPRRASFPPLSVQRAFCRRRVSYQKRPMIIPIYSLVKTFAFDVCSTPTPLQIGYILSTRERQIITPWEIHRCETQPIYPGWVLKWHTLHYKTSTNVISFMDMMASSVDN